MIDLATNRVPWCLLTQDEQSAFIAANKQHKHFQVFHKGTWLYVEQVPLPGRQSDVYRAIDPPGEEWQSSVFRALYGEA
tara:strand:+ start:35 stop:271 length:237 start_codon:yes stop_codon:yes gene_type:complete